LLNLTLVTHPSHAFSAPKTLPLPPYPRPSSTESSQPPNCLPFPT
jgi:hypothetical protein